MNELLTKLCSPDGFNIDDVVKLIETLPLEKLNETVKLEEYRALKSVPKQEEVLSREQKSRIEDATIDHESSNIAFSQPSVKPPVDKDKRATPTKRAPGTPDTLQTSPLPIRKVRRVSWKLPSIAESHPISPRSTRDELQSPSPAKLSPALADISDRQQSIVQQTVTPARKLRPSQRQLVISPPADNSACLTIHASPGTLDDNIPESEGNHLSPAATAYSPQSVAFSLPADTHVDADLNESHVQVSHTHRLPYLEGFVTECTALHIGVILQQRDIVKALLRRGVKINAQNDVGMTAFHFALRILFSPNNTHPAQNLYRIIDLLLDFGARVTLEDQDGHTVVGDVLDGKADPEYQQRAENIAIKIEKRFEKLLELRFFSESEDECYADDLFKALHYRYPLLEHRQFSLNDLAEKKYSHYSRLRNVLKMLNLMVVGIGIVGAVASLYYSLASLWRYLKRDVISDISNQLSTSLQDSALHRTSPVSIVVPAVPLAVGVKAALWGFQCYKILQNKSWFEGQYENLLEGKAEHNESIRIAIEKRHTPASTQGKI